MTPNQPVHRTADENHKAGARGATVALEVVDLDAILEYLKSKSVLPEKPFDIPTCRGCIIYQK